MIKVTKLLLVTMALLLIPLSSPPQVQAESIWEKITKTFQGKSGGIVEELVTGQGPQQQEEVKPPSIFQRFFDFIKKFSISLPKPAKKEEGVKNPFPTKAPLPEPSPLPEGSSLPQPESAGEPISQKNLTGKWLGRYTVNSPSACKGESGAWTANLTQTGNKLGGTFQSDAGSGSISGTASGQNLSWSVGGGGSGISFNGGSSSPNTISGSFTGPICDPEEAPQKTQGTFFGGR